MQPRRWKVIVLLAVTSLLLAAGQALATSTIRDEFQQRYPQAKKLANCNLCHTSTFGFNPYGKDLKAAGKNFGAIEGKDSDGDGVSNIKEIQAGTLPGDAGSKPSTAPAPKTEKKAGFRDLAGHWAGPVVEQLAQKGIIKGYPDGSFAPNRKVTRAEFAALVFRVMGLKEKKPARPAFSDLPAWAWYYGIVESLVAEGVIEGGSKSFNPDGEVSKATAARMIVTALGEAEQARALELNKVRNQLSLFLDADEVPDDAAPYLALASKKGLIKGEPGKFVQGYPVLFTLRPTESLTRAQAASVILEFYKAR